jgi:hypothetical protein
MKTYSSTLSFCAALLVATSASALTAPTEYNHNSYSCPNVNELQNQLVTRAPNTKTLTDAEGLQWQLTLSEEHEKMTFLHLSGFRSAMWNSHTQEITCVYKTQHSADFIIVTLPNVKQPNSTPWHLTDSKEHLQCRGKPHLCKFTPVNEPQ